MSQPHASLVAAALIAALATVGTVQPASVWAEGPQDEVPYLSGGVGKDEREQLEAEAANYNLKLTFARTDGAFVADVDVTVKSTSGATLLTAKSDGPLFFALLPPGDYEVVATYQDVAKQDSVAVGASGQREIPFRW